MTEEKFKLPRSSYEELSKIIKAYGKSSKPANNEEISKLTGIGKTHISANNSFLLAVGIIEGGNLKSCTSKGNQIARALEHEIPEEIAKGWKVIIEENEFLNKMVQAVGVRKGMEISQLENHIAYSAGEVKSKPVLIGSRTIINILLVSGLVRLDGDKVLPISGYSPPIESNTGTKDTVNILTKTKYDDGNVVTIHIELRINASPSELDGLGEKINKLIKDLSQG